MDIGLERWIRAYATMNLWRAPPWMSKADLIQEGYFCYMKVVRTYPGLAKRKQPTPNNRKVFMALVKTAFTKHVIDLANWRTAEPENAATALMAEADEGTSEEWMDRNAIGPLNKQITVGKWTNEMSCLVEAMSIDLGNEGKYKIITDRKTKRRRRETENEHLCRVATLASKRRSKMLGFPPTEFDPKKVDMVEVAMQYLGL
jgi:hypothetical protein